MGEIRSKTCEQGKDRRDQLGLHSSQDASDNRADRQVTEALQFGAFNLSARRLKVAAFMTESDHAPGREVQAGDVGDMADSFLQSWATWEWKNFYRGNDSLVRQVTTLQLN